MTSDYQDIELAILAGITNDRYLFSKVLEEGFQAELLYSPAARTVGSTLIALGRQPGAAIDLLVLKSKLQESALLTPQVAQCLEELPKMQTPQLAQLISYLEILKDRETKQRLLKLAERVDQYARGQGEAGRPVADFTAGAFQELLEIQRERVRKRVTPMGAMMEQIISEAQARPKGVPALLGYPLAPFDRLARVLSGLRQGFYYGLAGAPRRGKTTFALQLAASLAESCRIPVLFYSWEQTRKVLTARIMARATGINPTNWLSHNLDRLASASQRFASGLAGVRAYSNTLFVLEGTRQDTVDRIRATAYNLMHEFRTDSIAIFLDYLQKIPLTHPSGDLSSRIDQISTGLAGLSLELNCPVFAIAALDKEGCRLDDEPSAGEKENELLIRPRPTMHHCTGGGDIEYDLDVAMILSKDWSATHQLEDLLKTRRSGKRIASKIDILDLNIDKNRDAPGEGVQAVQYAFFIHENRFVELDYKREEEQRADFHGYARIQQIYQTLSAQREAAQAGVEKEAGYTQSP
jgi:replicative DNA helicase